MSKTRKIALILFIIGIVMILTGVTIIIARQKQCDKLPPNEFFSRDYCVRTLNN